MAIDEEIKDGKVQYHINREYHTENSCIIINMNTLKVKRYYLSLHILH